MLKFPRLLYAHRGANLKIPENSMEAFSEGLKAGANALELDVHATSDGVIVVFHDTDGLRVAGEKAEIKRTSHDSIKKWRLGPEKLCKVPTLTEVINTFQHVPINVDIKAHNLKTTSMVVDVVSRLQAQDRVLLTSDNLAVLKELRRLRYGGPLGMSMWEVVALYFLPKFVLRRFGWQGRAAQVPLQISIFRLASPWFITKCHALGIRVDFWVVNDNETARRLYSMGADGVMTDDPAAIQMPTSSSAPLSFF